MKDEQDYVGGVIGIVAGAYLLWMMIWIPVIVNFSIILEADVSEFYKVLALAGVIGTAFLIVGGTVFSFLVITTAEKEEKLLEVLRKHIHFPDCLQDGEVVIVNLQQKVQGEKHLIYGKTWCKTCGSVTVWNGNNRKLGY